MIVLLANQKKIKQNHQIAGLGPIQRHDYNYTMITGTDFYYGQKMLIIYGYDYDYIHFFSWEKEMTDNYYI